MFNNVFRQSDILWGKVKNYGRDRQATNDNIIWRTRTAWWIKKVWHTYTIIICSVSCSSTAEMVMRTHLYVTFICTLYIVCLVHSNRTDASFFPRYSVKRRKVLNFVARGSQQHSSSQLESHPFQAVRHCLSKIFPATFRNFWPSPFSGQRGAML